MCAASLHHTALGRGRSAACALPTLYTLSDNRVPVETAVGALRVQNDWELEHFSTAHDDSYILPVLRRALQINPSLKIVASPWTAPLWLKTGGGGRCGDYCTTTGCGWTAQYSCPWAKNPGTSGRAGNDGSVGFSCCCVDRTSESMPCGGDNSSTGVGSIGTGTLIDTDQVYSTYANYFARFVSEYARKGVTVDYVTLQNEPGHDGCGTMPCMKLTPGQEGRLAITTAAAFAAAGLGTKILGYDHNWDAPSYPQASHSH
jgi:hypothetical protein